MSEIIPAQQTRAAECKVLPFVRKPEPEPKPPANLLEQLERQLFNDDDI